MPKPKHKTMLKKEADKQGLKLGWIAHKADIEPTKFSRIANGTQLPNVSEALLIADILEVDVRDLWEPKKVTPKEESQSEDMSGTLEQTQGRDS